MIVPPVFARRIAEREGAAGMAWVESLPALSARCCARWRLEPDGEPLHGHVSVVLPVRRGHEPAMLKLGWLDADTRDEPVALAAWAGSGAARLLASDSDAGALLLERLDPARSLAGEPLAEAVGVAGGLLRRLAIPAPPLRRTLRGQARRWAHELPATWERLGRPLPRTVLDAAVGVCLRRGPQAGRTLVNQDLHYENVLAGTRERWLVIDPQPLAGDPEFGTIPLLWNRRAESSLDERFAAVVDAAGLDAVTEIAPWAHRRLCRAPGQGHGRSPAPGR